MSTITFQNQRYVLRDQESVLDGLLRHGVHIPSSCYSGVCQSCLMRSVDGAPPAAAQEGLRGSLRERGYFLACQCRPALDMEVALPGNDDLPLVSVKVVAKQALSQRVMGLRLRCLDGFTFEAGQFINLVHDGAMRSYSIANTPGAERTLELHIYRVDDGRVSGWIHNELAVGDTLTIQGPFGDCVYHAEEADRPLLLIATGCGLAPLRGVIHRALQEGHSAPIHLFHGSRSRDGVYLEDEMRALKGRHPQFHYTACLSGGEMVPGFSAGRASDLALSRHPTLKDWRIYLCGNSAMVRAARKKAFLAGAALADIHADPFEFSHHAPPSSGTGTAPNARP